MKQLIQLFAILWSWNVVVDIYAIFTADLQLLQKSISVLILLTLAIAWLYSRLDDDDLEYE